MTAFSLLAVLLLGIVLGAVIGFLYARAGWPPPWPS